MTSTTIAQWVYLVIGIPLVVWSFSAMFSAAGMRQSDRWMHNHAVWVHERSERSLQGFLAVVIAAVVVVVAALLMGLVAIA